MSSPTPEEATPPTTPTSALKSQLRNIGNRFRKDKDKDKDISSSSLNMTNNNNENTTTPTKSTNNIPLLSSIPSLKRPNLFSHEDHHNHHPQQSMTATTRDLYDEDHELGTSISTLNQIRSSLRYLNLCAHDHSLSLVSTSRTQRSLAQALVDVLNPNNNNTSDIENEQQGNINHQSTMTTKPEEESDVHFSTHIPNHARETMVAFGRGLDHVSNTASKLTSSIGTPINDLCTSFEERYERKIVPLTKRYADQKGQYLKYRICAMELEQDYHDLHDDDNEDLKKKKCYFDALADAAKPVWSKTSKELRAEADVMTELTAANIAQWVRNITLQHERAFAIAAANMADAFGHAKDMPPIKANSAGAGGGRKEEEKDTGKTVQIK